jgi:hypothetical protein
LLEEDVERERVSCGPAEKFEQQRSWAVKSMVVGGPTFTRKEWVPSPEGRNRAQNI